MSELTQEQIEFFHENGYLVIKDYFPSNAVSDMRNRMNEILNEMDTSVSKTVFSTGVSIILLYFFDIYIYIVKIKK